MLRLSHQKVTVSLPLGLKSNTPVKTECCDDIINDEESTKPLPKVITINKKSSACTPEALFYISLLLGSISSSLCLTWHHSSSAILASQSAATWTCLLLDRLASPSRSTIKHESKSQIPTFFTILDF